MVVGYHILVAQPHAPENIEGRAHRKIQFPLTEPGENLEVCGAAHAARIGRRDGRDLAQERDELGIDALLLAFDPGGVNEEFAARLGEERQGVCAEGQVRGLLPVVGHHHVASLAFAATKV